VAAKIARVARIAVFAGVALLVIRFALTYRSVRVPEGNDQMAPTLEPGAKVFLHRGFRRAKDFRRGYIVAYVARVGGAGAVEFRFGRVVATPGDRVELEPGPAGVSDAKVRVNGEMAFYNPELETVPAGPTGEVVGGRPAVARLSGSGTGRNREEGDGSGTHSARREPRGRSTGRATAAPVSEPPEPIIVPDGTLYLLNDRRSSRLADSRTAGPVDERSFVGKVVMSW
jgi:signal peptidase I